MSKINLKRCFDIALKASGKTKTELAKELGFTNALLTNACNGGSMSVEKLDKCANAMGFKLGEFIMLSDANAKVRTTIVFDTEL